MAEFSRGETYVGVARKTFMSKHPKLLISIVVEKLVNRVRVPHSDDGVDGDFLNKQLERPPSSHRFHEYQLSTH